MNVFAISERTIVHRRRLAWFWLLFVPILLASAVARAGPLALKPPLLWLLVGSVLAIELAGFVFMRLAIKELRGTVLRVADTGLEICYPKWTKKVAFNDIGVLRVYEARDGEIQDIRLIGKRMAIPLRGYENLLELRAVIERRLSGGSKVDIRRFRLDPNNPVVFSAVAVAVGGAVLAIIALFESYLDQLIILITVITGAVFLLYRPISRAAAARPRADIAIGGMILVLGFWEILRQFILRW